MNLVTSLESGLAVARLEIHTNGEEVCPCARSSLSSDRNPLSMSQDLYSSREEYSCETTLIRVGKRREREARTVLALL